MEVQKRKEKLSNSTPLIDFDKVPLEHIYGMQPLPDHQYMLFGGFDKPFLSLNPATKAFEPLAKPDPDETINLVSCGGSFFFASKEGSLYCLDAKQPGLCRDLQVGCQVVFYGGTYPFIRCLHQLLQKLLSQRLSALLCR